MTTEFNTSIDYAKHLDKNDALALFRERFYIPKDTIYLDGNSLGLMSRESEENLLNVINEWKTLGINGWFKGSPPWWYYGEKLGALIAPLVGAKPEEVVATGTTTVNLHNLVSTFYHPVKYRKKILADELNFPSDIYALKSQIKLKGLEPDNELILVKSKDGRTIDENDIVEYMGEDIALILLPSALYKSGQLLDMEYLTKEAHKKDITIGFDCSHSVGAVPHNFDKCEIDFAFWCSYKYLNSGPGSTAFLYVNKEHFQKEPGLTGWFGYVKDKQFEMLLDFEHSKSSGGWQISSSNILCSGAIQGALKITLEVGIEKIRQKSIELTTYLIKLADEKLSKYNFKIGTPRDPNKRTGHIALEHERAFEISQKLLNQGVIIDFRPPNIIRIAPTALYNSFEEIWKIIEMINKIIEKI